MGGDFDVRVCSRICGYDAAYQPPEVKLCPNCKGVLVAVPQSMLDAFEQQQIGRTS